MLEEEEQVILRVMETPAMGVVELVVMEEQEVLVQAMEVQEQQILEVVVVEEALTAPWAEMVVLV